MHYKQSENLENMAISVRSRAGMASSPRSILRPHLSGPVDVIHLHPPTCNARSQLSGPVQYPTRPNHESNRREHSVATANAPRPTHMRRSRSSSRKGRRGSRNPHEDNRSGEADGHLDDGRISVRRDFLVQGVAFKVQRSLRRKKGPPHSQAKCARSRLTETSKDEAAMADDRTQRDRTHMDRYDAVRGTQHPQTTTTTTYPKARSRVHVQELSRRQPSDAEHTDDSLEPKSVSDGRALHQNP
ncbi:hypothetical protein D9611_014075 [Ephemerocybe angulata]|uniref:Uncharacterized protein n=1 Tax=Ephemerocybe angulata TaxID=980116 RepID=A0A8H5ERF6_9AGAR|nr:hypothetical protein D9611_014075 [Tulosesus angulatus]